MANPDSSIVQLDEDIMLDGFGMVNMFIADQVIAPFFEKTPALEMVKERLEELIAAELVDKSSDDYFLTEITSIYNYAIGELSKLSKDIFGNGHPERYELFERLHTYCYVIGRSKSQYVADGFFNECPMQPQIVERKGSILEDLKPGNDNARPIEEMAQDTRTVTERSARTTIRGLGGPTPEADQVVIPPAPRVPVAVAAAGAAETQREAEKLKKDALKCVNAHLDRACTYAIERGIDEFSAQAVAEQATKYYFENLRHPDFSTSLEKFLMGQYLDDTQKAENRAVVKNHIKKFFPQQKPFLAEQALQMAFDDLSEEITAKHLSGKAAEEVARELSRKIIERRKTDTTWRQRHCALNFFYVLGDSEDQHAVIKELTRLAQARWKLPRRVDSILPPEDEPMASLSSVRFIPISGAPNNRANGKTSVSSNTVLSSPDQASVTRRDGQTSTAEVPQQVSVRPIILAIDSPISTPSQVLPTKHAPAPAKSPGGRLWGKLQQWTRPIAFSLGITNALGGLPIHDTSSYNSVSAGDHRPENRFPKPNPAVSPTQPVAATRAPSVSPTESPTPNTSASDTQVPVETAGSSDEQIDQMIESMPDCELKTILTTGEIVVENDPRGIGVQLEKAIKRYIAIAGVKNKLSPGVIAELIKTANELKDNMNDYAAIYYAQTYSEGIPDTPEGRYVSALTKGNPGSIPVEKINARVHGNAGESFIPQLKEARYKVKELKDGRIEYVDKGALGENYLQLKPGDIVNIKNLEILGTIMENIVGTVNANINSLAAQKELPVTKPAAPAEPIYSPKPSVPVSPPKLHQDGKMLLKGNDKYYDDRDRMYGSLLPENNSKTATVLSTPVNTDNTDAGWGDDDIPVYTEEGGKETRVFLSKKSQEPAEKVSIPATPQTLRQAAADKISQLLAQQADRTAAQIKEVKSVPAFPGSSDSVDMTHIRAANAQAAVEKKFSFHIPEIMHLGPKDDFRTKLQSYVAGNKSAAQTLQNIFDNKTALVKGFDIRPDRSRDYRLNPLVLEALNQAGATGNEYDIVGGKIQEVAYLDEDELAAVDEEEKSPAPINTNNPAKQSVVASTDKKADPGMDEFDAEWGRIAAAAEVSVQNRYNQIAA